MHNKSIKINGRCIGKKEPVFIIAEAGVNHNGNLRLAKMLVDAAKSAGADAIKFQTFNSENLVSRHAGMASYQEQNLGKKSKQIEMLKKLELSYPDFKKLKEYCDRKDILFLSTPHTEDAIDFLEPLVPFFKIGSGDLTNLPFLSKIAKKGKPMIISTGMANIFEVNEAAITIKLINDRLIILHCTTSYPCVRHSVHLAAMKTIENSTGCLVGYSDHTMDIDVMAMAASMGAVVIEKHLTLKRTMKGPDHMASLEPKEFKKGVKLVRNIKNHPIKLDEEVIGSFMKLPTMKELEILPFIRKSIVSSKPIKKGKIITASDIIIKRPATGIQPKYINQVIGKRIVMNIREGTPITMEMIK